MSKRSQKMISVVIPARNEEALIHRTLEAVLQAVAYFEASGHQAPPLAQSHVEVIVVDNRSTDRTPEIVKSYSGEQGVQLLRCRPLRAPCARNLGAGRARGRVLVFVDADTLMPPQTLHRIWQLSQIEGYEAGISGLASLESGVRAQAWWLFWGQVRRLPLPRAKAMPALMFCTRAVFRQFGPFDEQVAIGEEWPILADFYRAHPARFVYDRSLVALTSSRRMELEPFGYVRTFLRYVWAILHVSGRVNYGDHCRYSQPERIP